MLNRVEKIKIPATKMLQSLRAIKAMQQRSKTEYFSWVRLFTENNGLHVAGIADGLYMQHRLLDCIDTRVDTAFDLEPVYNFMRKLAKKAEVQITCNGGVVVLQSGGLSFTTPPVKDDFEMWEPVSFDPKNSELDYCNLTVDVQDFVMSLSDVAHAMSYEETRYYLNGVYAHPEDVTGEFLLVATDGHTLSRRRIEGSNCEDWGGGIISKYAVKHILSNLAAHEEVATISANDVHFSIESDGVRISSKLVDGTFPDYRRVVPSEPDIQVSINRDSFIEVLKPFIGKKSETLGINFENDEFIFTKIETGGGTLKSSTPVDLHQPESGGLIQVGVDPQYLMDCLRALRGRTATMNFKTRITSPRDSEVKTVEWDAGPMTLTDENALSGGAIEVLMPRRR